MTDKLLHWHVTYRAYTAEGHVHNYLVTKSPGGDCWLAMKKLATLQTPAGAGEFGHSVAVSGNTAVVGAPFTSVGSQTAAGTVYIYTKGSTGWHTQPTATLDDPPGLANDNFGTSVAISGNTIPAPAINSPTTRRILADFMLTSL